MRSPDRKRPHLRVFQVYPSVFNREVTVEGKPADLGAKCQQPEVQYVLVAVRINVLFTKIAKLFP